MNKYAWGLVAILAIVCFWLFKTNQELKITKEAYNQNALALGDSLRYEKSEKADLYTKYISILDANKYTTEELSAKNERVLALTKENLQLRDIIEQGTGTTTTDTSGIRYFTFKDKTDFYNYLIEVQDIDPPTYYFNIKFNPLSLTNYITRNKEGIWSSYIKIDAPFNKYLSVADIQTILDKDEWVGLPKDEGFSLGLIPLGTAIIDEGNTHISIGALASISNKWVLGYSKAIGMNLNMFHVGYQFKIIK